MNRQPLSLSGRVCRHHVRVAHCAIDPQSSGIARRNPMFLVSSRSIGRSVHVAIETPRRIAATTTLGLTLLSISMSGMAPATVSAQSASMTAVGTPAAVMCPVDTSNVPAAASDAAGVYTIASDKSTAGYTVQEVLTGKGNATAIGTTDAVVGTILLDKSGAALPCSVFYVDLRTLTTDEDRRDGQVQKVLEAETYPLGTFIMTSRPHLQGDRRSHRPQCHEAGDVGCHREDGR